MHTAEIFDAQNKRLISTPSGGWLYLAIAAIILCVSGVLITGGYYYAQSLRRGIAVENARTFLTSIVVLHKYYSKSIVPNAKAAGAGFSINYKSTTDKIPFPATLSNDFGTELQKVSPNLYTNLYSTFPFIWNAGRALDEFEKLSLSTLAQNPNSEFIRFESRGNHEVVRLAIGMTLTKDCLSCHNDPQFNTRRVWKVGDMRGARQVSLPVPGDLLSQEMVIAWGSIIALLAATLGGLLVVLNVRSLRAALNNVSDLSNKLQVTNLSLLEANRKKSEFLAGVSHDLRTPLNAISGFSEAIKLRLFGKLGDDRYGEYAGYVHDSAGHLLALINQVMDIHRIEDGRWEYNETQINAAALIDAVVPIVQAKVDESSVVLEARKPQKNFRFCGDETALRQIYINLIENAIKYSQGDNVIVAIVTGNQSVRLEVEDNGIGVSPSELEELKDLSSRGSAKYGGLPGYGIGLWLVEKFADLHGGTFSVETPVNGGSRFVIEFQTETN